jgi:hypothetical protein
MKCENEKLGCSFSVPDRPTVRQQLAYFSLVEKAEGQAKREQYWLAAQPLITDWQCEALPDPKTSLDDMTNPSQTFIVLWAGAAVFGHMNTLDDLPKN